jgi:type I restriction enzyme S subunit
MDFEGPADWPAVSLAELGEVNRGRSRHRPRHAEHLYGGPYPFIQTGDIKSSGGRISSYSQTYSEAGLAQSRLWPTGTMCITIAANIAETAILGFPACFPDSVVGFIADSSKADVRFIEFMFRQMRRTIQHQATGSVQDNINLETLGRLRFPLPPLPEQKRIAHILGTLDDKIELNRRMNATLEGISRAIFKSWFVDFDPVRQKAAGKQPVGMDAQKAAIFPESFEDSEIGEVPCGWGICPLSECVEILSGGTPSTSNPEYWGGPIPWFSVKDAPSDCDVWVLWTEKSVTQAGIDNSATQELPAGTTIVSARGTVGRLALVGVPMAMNQSCYGVRGIDGQNDLFIYYLLRESVAELQQRTHGTVFDTITRDTFASLSVVAVPKTVAGAFGEAAAPLLETVKRNLLQSRTLAALRDTLLPKLLSGEIRIPEAEQAVEEAIA